MAKLSETASQTAGPYVHIGCLPDHAGTPSADPRIGSDLQACLTGPPIVIEGLIFDGKGVEVKDAMVELWQADGSGQYGRGFDRSAVDPETGQFRFETVKPGQVRWDSDTMQAPHVALWIVARGINIGLHTRIYFGDDDHSGDPVLRIVPGDRRQTLIAQRDGDLYRHHIHLQGSHETVFFDV